MLDDRGKEGGEVRMPQRDGFEQEGWKVEQFKQAWLMGEHGGEDVGSSTVERGVEGDVVSEREGWKSVSAQKAL